MRESLEPRDSDGDDDVMHERTRQFGPVHVRSVFVGGRGPGGIRLIALAIAALMIGGAFLVLGLLLLTALVAVGALAGGGYLVWRRMRRAIRGAAQDRPPLELDPTMEISAPRDATDHFPPDRPR